MINEKIIKQVFAVICIGILLVFTFLIIKPIFLSIIFGLILAYTLNPVDKFILKYIKNKSVTSFITCILLLFIIFLIIWFFIPILIIQIFDGYVAVQAWDIVSPLKQLFPILFTSDRISASFISAYNSFLANTVNVSMQKLTNILINLPSILLQFLVVFLVFFYSLRDGDKILTLLRDSLPFDKSLTERFIKKSKQITFSVVFGRIVIGLITGIVAGIGFFFAGIDNALLLTFISIIAAIVPIIGPWIVWVPVVLGLFIAGRTLAGVLLLIYCGIIVSFIDNVLHVLFISKKSQISIFLTLIGLIGGIFAFGLFGIILGPLLVAYLSILFDIYREYNIKSKTTPVN